jgi:hypothetical protein
MNCVLTFNKFTEKQIVVSGKIASWISSLLRIKLVDTKQKAQEALQSDIDTLFIVNGILVFCDFRNEIKQMVDKAKHIVWIGNDYQATIIPWAKKKPSLRRIAVYENFDNLKNHTVLDLNKLLHKSLPKRDFKYEGMFYYGALRKNRVEVFRKWFNHDMFDVYISTAQRNAAEFHAISPLSKIYKADGEVQQFLRLFQSSIYIEDQIITDKIPHCPANRFYEVTGSKVLLLYDGKAKSTLMRAGYWDDAFCVNSVLDYKRKLENWQELRDKQIAMFGERDFKAELNREFLAVL